NRRGGLHHELRQDLRHDTGCTRERIHPHPVLLEPRCTRRSRRSLNCSAVPPRERGRNRRSTGDTRMWISYLYESLEICIITIGLVNSLDGKLVSHIPNDILSRELTKWGLTMEDVLSKLFNEFDRKKISRRHWLQALGLASVISPMAAFGQGSCSSPET